MGTLLPLKEPLILLRAGLLDLMRTYFAITMR